MIATANNSRIHRRQGFDVYTLRNDCVEILVVPELGAKIISLKNLRTGREWLWHPAGELKLFCNRAGDDFFQSPLTGIDECLPTIAPCLWQGRELPDHGEVWSVPWQVNSTAWENGILRTSICLKTLPLEFERTIELQENEIQISYQLANRGEAEEKFVWAFHPLLKLQPGDELELPESTRALLNGADWIDAIAFAAPENQCAKNFATPVNEGFAAVKNSKTGDRLKFIWDTAENDTLGLWLTRGGWHGHHHFSIEPTNAADDSLAAAAGQNHCGKIPGNGLANWRLLIQVGA
jgi:galactose mutarotase-like enzyme